MKFLTTIIGFLPVLCVVAPSSAALRTTTTDKTGRISVSPSVSVTGATNLANIAAARRLPTLLKTGSATATATATSTTSESSLMDEIECVNSYTDCIKANDVCDFNFEECTTKELFYAKKPQCNSVLLQCDSAGINTLFGTSDTTNLAAKNDQEQYVYPTDGSVLGQFIEAGAISNRLDTSSCVKRYTSCLKKDNVCGEDFELCTTNSEFKKQRIYCESTRARCQEEGLKELFGSTNHFDSPSSTSRIGEMITEGQQLAALNSVSTCYKVADQCVLSACGVNPYKCIVNSSTLLAQAVDAINEERELTPEQAKAVADARTKADVSKYIKGLCYETIAGNKYCYATVLKSMPTTKQLVDEENRDEIYSDIISSTMTRVDNQLQLLLDRFDKKAKDACSDTIAACAMRSCGGGLGSACYQSVFGSGPTGDMTALINGNATAYAEIKTGCQAIVNTDANCQYAAASVNAHGYNYSYIDKDTFTTLFPEGTDSDPIGVITRLTASLKENYSPAAIAEMAKQCKNTATSCIRSLCGQDFKYCYRTRTDVMADTYNTGNASFDASMNKLGGVLDFNIVRGLCVSTVKDSSICDEHLKIERVKHMNNGVIKGWGQLKTGTVREAWVDAAKGYKATNKTAETDILIGCTIRSSSSTVGGGLMGRGPTQSSVCESKAGSSSYIEECGTVDEDGCLYDEEQYMTETDYQYNMAVNTLFREVLADVELEAQAKYNAKLTAEQRMCVDANSGGIMGKRDMSGTYMWVKLKSNKVPKNYSVSGLKESQFEKSDDLYGSFCRARVTLQSDDQDLQQYLQKGKSWATTYFAVGDVFTCGSWIPQKELETIAKKVACKKAVVKGTLPSDTNCDSNVKVDSIGLTTAQKWATAAAAIGGVGLGGAGGAYLADAVQSSNLLGGLWQPNRNSDEQNSRNVLSASTCRSYYGKYNNAVKNYNKKFRSDATDADGDGQITFADQRGDVQNYGKDASAAALGMRNTASTIVTRNVMKKDDKDKYRDEAVQNFKDARDSVDNYCTDAESAVSPECQAAVDSLGTLCKNVEDFNGQLANYDNNTKRQIINTTSAVLGATGLGLTAAFAVANNVKASNRQKFTDDQQEFMDNIGSSIYCFIGADEAGTYGDLIEITAD